jgi:vitamin B12 transporter
VRNHVRIPSTFVLSSALFAAFAAPAVAQDSVLPETVVTATRVPTPIDRVASSITVIGSDDIARRGLVTLPDALRTVPGLSVVQTGAGGRNLLTSVFTRGTNSNHTLVLIDGIRANDPSSPSGAFDFSTIDLDDVERIEVLRGPQGTLYGSDAIGGVVNVITKSGKGPLAGSATVKGGSYGTFGVAGSLRGGLLDDWLTFALNAQRTQTDGFPIAPPALRPAGASGFDDGSHDWTVNAKLGYRFTDTFSVSAVGRFSKSFANYDANQGDPNAEQRNDERFIRGEAKLDLLDGRFANTFGVSDTYYNRRNTNFGDPFYSDSGRDQNNGERVAFDWQGDLYVTETQIVTLGFEHANDKIDASSVFNDPVSTFTFAGATSASRRSNAGYAQLQSQFGDRFFSTIGVRVDSVGGFGEETTWRVAPAYLVPETGTKLKASYGTAFKAPTLYQLYNLTINSFGGFTFPFTGNPNLKPETSRGYDIGFEQTLFGKRIGFGSTYFNDHIDDLIDFNAGFDSLINVGSARTKGIESYLTYAVTKDLDLRLDHTWTVALNGRTDTLLLRRPRHKASLGADWQATEDLSLSSTLLFVGTRRDIDRVTGATINQTPTFTVDLSGRYRITPSLTAFSRLSNLLDRTYEDPNGYRAAGRAVLVGLTASF